MRHNALALGFMKTIWKWTVSITDIFYLTMPIGANILTVQKQGDDICLWAEVDTAKKPNEEREFSVVGTGRPRPEGQYLGSALVGSFVWHVYEINRKNGS